MQSITIGTRGSLLAVTQSTWVKKQIVARYPDISVNLLKITTKGDKILDVPLAKVGGKGLFVKEIEDALLAGHIDLAVHSMKDVPTELPAGLEIAIVPPRENPGDAFISSRYASLDAIPAGGTIGTSSLRRKAQLAALRPDLDIQDLRGNLDTRLRKLEEGQYDAIILAAAGLNRLGLQKRITRLFSAKEMVPAIGQGALGIELRTRDKDLLTALQFLHHPETATAVAAERAFLFRLEGGCQVPIGAHATVSEQGVELTGLIASVDGRVLLRDSRSAAQEDAATLGTTLADVLLERGGREILAEVYDNG